MKEESANTDDTEKLIKEICYSKYLGHRQTEVERVYEIPVQHSISARLLLQQQSRHKGGQ